MSRLVWQKWFVGFMFVLFAQVSFGLSNGGEISLKAKVGEPFAADLVKLTKVSGTYEKVTGPDWLYLTKDGIVFSPLEGEYTGEYQMFFAIKHNEQEAVYFKLNLSFVEYVQPTPEIAYKAKVGEVFHVNLNESGSKEVSFEFQNLPEWIEVVEGSILIGMPKAEHVGNYEFSIYQKVGESMSTTIATIEVTDQDETKFLELYVGRTFESSVYQITGKAGPFKVSFPSFFEIGIGGLISATPTVEDIGTYVMTIQVKEGLSVFTYKIPVRVNPSPTPSK